MLIATVEDTTGSIECVVFPKQYAELQARFVEDAIGRMLGDDGPVCERPIVLSHNDVNPTNLVHDGERLLLLDWETAGPNEPFYDLAAISIPAEQTGGDIYDLLTLAAGPRVFVLLADATGHGIGPALSVTQVRSMLRIGLRLDASLEDLLSQVNAQLYQDLGSSRFVTAFLGASEAVAHLVA